MTRETNTLTQAQNQTQRIQPKRVFMPRSDVYETESDLVILADMPGVNEKSVDITIEKNVLTIHGAVEPPFAGKNPVRAEYDIGDYKRAFTLPEEIDRGNIRASVKNGTLKLTLPKAIAAKARKIAVSAQ